MCAKRGLTTFRHRISIERRILKMINETMTLSEPLTGLTKGAVAAWSCHLNEHFDAQQIRKLVKIVNEISARALVNTDCSRDVFSTDDLKRSTSFQALCSRLENSLREVVSFNQPIKLP